MEGSARNFIISAAATFFGGIALLIVEPLIFHDPAASLKKEISIDNVVPITLDGPAQKKISDFLIKDLKYKKIDEVSHIDIGVARIENNGNSDIADFEIDLISRVKPEDGDFLAAGLIDMDTDTEDYVPVDVGGGTSVTIPVELLKPSETVQFFYVMSPFNIPEISVREAGVDIVEQQEDSIIPEIGASEGFGNIVYILLFSVSSFLLGIGLMSAFHDQMLRQIGFDPKEIMEAYELAQKGAKKDD